MASCSRREYDMLYIRTHSVAVDCDDFPVTERTLYRLNSPQRRTEQPLGVPRHSPHPFKNQSSCNPALPRAPHAARSRRLCQPPWPQPTSRNPHPLSGETSHEERRNSNARRTSGEGGRGRGASLREAASPPEYLTSPSASPVHA